MIEQESRDGVVRRKIQVKYKESLFSMVGNRNELYGTIMGSTSLELGKTQSNAALNELLLLTLAVGHGQEDLEVHSCLSCSAVLAVVFMLKL